MLHGSYGILSADGHKGYAMPIGGCVAYKDHISVSGVGFDIGCGNKAVKTNILAQDVDIARVMDEIVAQIGFGVGRPNPSPVQHPVLDAIATAAFAPQRKLVDMAAAQLGTVGSGNHFVDLFEGQDGYLWVGVHFGSRGFGHKTAMGFIALHQGLNFEEKGKEGDMDSYPILLPIAEQLGQDYIMAMELAGAYAYAGRDVVVDKVLKILGASTTYEVHNHHNFAWRETHANEDFWVVRKGCTPAAPGQQGFIGANMLDNSVIVEGLDTPMSKLALYTTVHGAGRIMSRTQAAGKSKWVKGKRINLGGGLINFADVQHTMREHNVVLRGAGADEAPGAYKSLKEVLAYQGETIKVLHTLRPIGVAMAGPDIEDPYKD